VRWDVAVLGAGSAGAATAALCAARGLRVVCLERRPLDAAGACWTNAVPGRFFDEAGLPRPAGAECGAVAGSTCLSSAAGGKTVRLRPRDMLQVDMRLLVARLQDAARQAGAELRGSLAAEGLEHDVLRTSAGPVRAGWFVDATGLSGARLLRQPVVSPQDVCAAAQEVRRVRDREAARAWLAARGAAPAEGLSIVGGWGGYSVLAVRVTDELVDLLAGTIPAAGQPPGHEVLRDFVAGQSWIGARISGGAGLIPLRRPYDLLGDGSVALVGDAACQVFSAHGSGVGFGLVAARLLADALAEDRGVAGYAASWQRRYGGLAAAYDVLRRWTQDSPPMATGRLIDAGVLAEPALRRGVEQQPPAASPGELARAIFALVREPRLGAGLALVAARMLALLPLYARYPEDPRLQPRWARFAAVVHGAPRDA
jgi:flavin-dependent dehydrogenase